MLKEKSRGNIRSVSTESGQIAYSGSENIMNTTQSISLLGSGWLGLPLARRFQSNGYSVRVSTTSPDRQDALKTEGFLVSMLDIGDLSGEIHEFLQADTLICNIPSKDLDGFARLIKEIEKSPISQVVFVSSTSVYSNDAGVVNESDGKELGEHPLIQIEKLFLTSERFATTIVRFGGLIGYSRHPGRFFRPGRAVSDAQARVNLIHRDDCINIISEIIKQGAWGETFNCCADSHPSKKEFYGRAMQKLGVVPKFENSVNHAFKIIRNDTVKKRLNYRFVHSDLMAIDFNKEYE